MDDFFSVNRFVIALLTFQGLIENLLYLVQRIGFVPNGSRVYYEHRSQPPLLIPMVQSYLEHTGDLAFVRDNFDLIEREFLYWMNNAVIEVSFKRTSIPVSSHKLLQSLID